MMRGYICPHKDCAKNNKYFSSALSLCKHIEEDHGSEWLRDYILSIDIASGMKSSLKGADCLSCPHTKCKFNCSLDKISDFYQHIHAEHGDSWLGMFFELKRESDNHVFNRGKILNSKFLESQKREANALSRDVLFVYRFSKRLHYSNAK